MTRGLGWTIIDQWGRQGLSLLIFAILANLLFPVDFGLVALASVFVGFAQIFVDQGLGDALVQRRTLTRGHIDTAFWVAIATGALLTGAGIVLAIPIAALLGEPALEPVLQVLSLVFVLSALNSIQTALLRRELAFRSLALRTLFAIAGGGVVGIAMAYANFGAWALIGQTLAQAALAAAVLWTVSPWRPGRQFSSAHFRELFGFGVNVVGSDMLIFLSRNVDNLLIGAVLGTQLLGIYSVGYRILEATGSLLVGISRKIAFPALSRLQDDPERMRRAFFRVARMSGVIVLPGYLGLALIAPEMIVVLFGDRWADSGPVASMLFLIGPVLAIQGFSGALLNAAGHPEIVFRYRLMATLTNVTGFVIAVPFGILAVAAAFVVRGYLLLPLDLYWLRRYGGIPSRAYLAQFRGIVVATLAMAATVICLKLLVAGGWGDALLLAAEVVLGAGTFVAALLLVERRLVREVWDVARQTLPGGERGRRRRGPKASRTAGADGPAPEPRLEDS